MNQNLTPAEIALRNLVANQFGVSDTNLLDALVRAAPAEATADLVVLVEGMLTGPAGDLTGTLTTTDTGEDDCHCVRGYLTGLQEVHDGMRADPELAGKDLEITQNVMADLKGQIAARMAHVQEYGFGEAQTQEATEAAPVVIDIEALLAGLFGRVTTAR